MDVTVQTLVPKLILLIVFWHQGNVSPLSLLTERTEWGGLGGRREERGEREGERKRSFDWYLDPALL